jgi:hypothetical protein
MPCPECPETPDTGCLHPITTECVTYNGNDVDCANIASGQTLNQVIEQLANNDCDLQEQIEDIVQDIEELSGNVTDIKNQINNINSFSCEDLSGCTLDELGDVDVTHVSGDILMSNGTKWINYTPEEIVPYQFTCEELSGCTLDELSGVVITNPVSGDVLIFNGYQWSNSNLDSLIESYIFPAINSINQQLDYLTSHLYDCCATTTPSGNSFLGTEAQLCTESIQGRITFDITYDGISGITNIQVLQKALIVPTATPNQVISVTNSNMIVPSPPASNMRAEIANISNLNNKLRLLVQYKESAIVKQGYLYFDLPHFQLTDNFCIDAVPSIFESLYVL